MNYAYDIFLNFHKTLYEFYEWEKNDQITHIKKIPLFKVDSQVLKDIKEKNINLNIDIEAEVYKGKNIKACLVCDNNEVIAIKKNKELFFSSLLLSEEDEIIKSNRNLEKSPFVYEILENKEPNYFKTRQDLENQEMILNKFKNMDINEMKYLYYECFNTKNDNFLDIQKEFKKEINNPIIVKTLLELLKNA